MVSRRKNRPTGRHWRRLALATAGAAVMVGACCWIRSALLPRATAEPVAPAQPAPAPTLPAASSPVSDYASRIVAFLYDNEPVSRQELGEYLITRAGAEKLEALVNRRIIEEACRDRGLEVTGAEVEASLAEDLKGLNVDRATFVSGVLSKYHKTLYEWKEDVIRPKLLLTKLCRDRVHVTERDIQEAYEAHYGEKIDCRIILWPPGKDNEQKAMAEYPALRDSEEAFAERAKRQQSPSLSATGGKIKPIAWHTMGDDNLEREAFKLRPGQVSTLLPTSQGTVLLRCDRRIPADTSVNLDKVRPQLAREVLERKVAVEIQGVFRGLRTQAHPNVLLKKYPSGPLQGKTEGPAPEVAGPPQPRQVVATYNGNRTVTRAELSEYLITRYGTEKLELLVNHRIIDRACRERGIQVSDAEVEAALEEDLKLLNMDRAEFARNLLGHYRKSLWEWKEDVIRPRLLLTKLCRDRVQPTDEEIKHAFEAHYGDKVDCRIILWPPDQTKFALTEYAKIRDSAEEFDRKAKQQASPTLAAQGGKVPPFGRYSFGDENVEREAFKLHPGEISTLIGTPQGNVVLKLEGRIPADTSIKLAEVRPQLLKEVMEKKVQAEMQVAFKELRDKANPRLLLKDPGKAVDLAEETRRILADTPGPTKRPH